MARQPLKTIWKYRNRETDQVSYFGRSGNEYFQRSKKFKHFKFEGMISKEQQEEEEAEALNNVESQNQEADEQQEQLDLDISKTRAKTKELTDDEINKLTKKKKVKVSKEDTEEEADLKAGSADLED